MKGTSGKVKMPVSKKRKKKSEVVESMPKGREKNPMQIKYICTDCGVEEMIPLNVVRTFDELDQSDINEPPQFDCENCGGLMRPERYISVFGKIFEYKKDSE